MSAAYAMPRCFKSAIMLRAGRIARRGAIAIHNTLSGRQMAICCDVTVIADDDSRITSYDDSAAIVMSPATMTPAAVAPMAAFR